MPVAQSEYEGYDEWLDQLETMPLDEALDLARTREMERRLAYTLDAEREQRGGDHDQRERDACRHDKRDRR
jgi:hypothetical protein